MNMRGTGVDFAKKYGWYLLLFTVGTLFLLFYSVSTSPFTSNTYGTDSAFFQMVGQNMRKGAVMYRDIFDVKGPYLFAIQYLGQLLYFGRYGIFCIQIINLFCILLIIDKIYQFLCGRREFKERIIIFALFFVIWSFTVDCGNLTEEYSLLPLLSCMYLFFKCLKKGHGYNICFGFMGGMFGFLAFMRLTNAGFICVLACVLFFELFFQKKFLWMFEAVFCFLLGGGIAALPVCLYYASENALADMLYATFGFGFQYALREPGTIRYNIISILLVTAAAAAWLNRKERSYLFFSFLSAVEMVMILLLGNGYVHYYQLILPPVLGNLILIFRKRDEISFAHIKKILAIFSVLALLANGGLILAHGGRVLVAIGLNTPQMEHSMIGKLAKKIEVFDSYGYGTYGYGALMKIEEIKDIIPQGASVYNYGTRPLWLLKTSFVPYSRYCQTQDLFIQCNPAIADEIDRMFEEAPPDYVVTEKYAEIQNAKIKGRLQTMYHIQCSNELYILYEKNRPAL